jgi:hypothetical protein
MMPCGEDSEKEKGDGSVVVALHCGCAYKTWRQMETTSLSHHGGMGKADVGRIAFSFPNNTLVVS